MKKMLPLLIGLLLVVAAAYYFLKKKDVNLPATIDDLGGSTSKKLLDLNDTDSIVDSLSLSGSLNKSAKNWGKNIVKWRESGTNNWSKTKGLASAQNNSITYAQQCVLDGLWQMYATSGLITREQYNTLSDELMSLGE